MLGTSETAKDVGLTACETARQRVQTEKGRS